MIYASILSRCLIPVAHLLLSFLTFHFSLHTSNQRLRWSLLPLFLCFSAFSFTTSKHFSIILPAITSLWAQSVALNIVHVTSLLFIEKWPAPPQDQRSPSWSAASYATYRLWSNPQLLPKTNHRLNNNKKDEESLAVFLLLRLAKVPLYYYLHTRVLPLIFSETLVELLPSDVAQPALLLRLHDVTPREVVVRSYIAVSWIWESLVFLDGANAILAVFSVIVGLDRPHDWPPLFGSPVSACGLRNFWSSFWHRLAVRPYTNYARLATSRGLGMSRGKSSSSPFSYLSSPLAHGTVIAFIVFLLSGLSHAVVSWRLGMRDWLDVKWFLLNFAACLTETVVLSTMRQLARKGGLVQELQAVEESWLGRLAGYSWVFAFFFWSVPLWRYPRVHGELVKVERWMSILSKMSIVTSDVAETL